MGRRGSFSQISQQADEIPLAHRSQDGLGEPVQMQLSSSAAESPKPVYTTTRLAAFRYGCVHILPVLATITILTFNFTNMYWNDLGAPHQNTILNSLQYAAALHGILMQLSLSAIVLQRIQLLLTSSKGVPLGLVTAGYRIIDGGFLFSKEFWAGATAPRRSNGTGWALVATLIGSAIALTALAAPSSAVVMIPQLDWWPVKHPFSWSLETCYLNVSTSNIWPQSLPTTVSFNPDDDYSVLAGYNFIREWISNSMNQGTDSNFTVNTGNGGFRHLSSVQMTKPGSNSSLYAGSTVSHRQARDLGSFWQFLENNGLGPEEITRPIMEPRFTDENVTMMKPLVQVECSMTKLTNSTTGLVFPHSQIISQDASNEYQDAVWPVPDFFTDWDAFKESFHGSNLSSAGSFQSFLNQSSMGMNSTFVNVTDFKNGPSAAAVFILMDEVFTPQIVPCSIVAYWSPVTIWLNPHIDTTVYESSPNASSILHASEFQDTAKYPRITIPPSWVEGLNAVISPDTLNEGFDDRISPLTHAMRSWGYGKVDHGDGSSHRVIAGYGTIPDHAAVTLSLYIAEALSRVNHIEHSSWVFHDPIPTPKGEPELVLLDNLHQNNQSDDYITILQNNRKEGMTEFTFGFQRYGYAWSFRAVTVRLAAAVLMLHVVLAIGHLIVLLWTGWASNSWRSPGEMLALAVRRADSSLLHNAGAGINKIEAWRGMVYVRAVETAEDTVELLIDETGAAATGLKLKAGRKYR